MRKAFLTTLIAASVLGVSSQERDNRELPTVPKSKAEIIQELKAQQRYAVDPTKGDGICNEYGGAELLEGLRAPQIITKNPNIESQLCNIHNNLDTIDFAVNRYINNTGATITTTALPQLPDGTGYIPCLYTVDMYEFLGTPGGRLMFWDTGGQRVLSTDINPKDLDGYTMALYRARVDMFVGKGQRIYPMQFDSYRYAIGVIKTKELNKLFAEHKRKESGPFVFPFKDILLLYQPEYFYSPFTPKQPIIPPDSTSE